MSANFSTSWLTSRARSPYQMRCSLATMVSALGTSALCHSLCIQQISLHYLKCLIENKAFKPNGFKESMYSHSTAVLLIFLSDDELTVIKHVHIGLIVCCVGSKLFTLGGILPFVDSIENDLKEVREKHMQGKEVGWAWSYSCLVANYRGMMALPMEPPFCLMYPKIYDDNAADKTHFNPMDCPSGMYTQTCMCHSNGSGGELIIIIIYLCICVTSRRTPRCSGCTLLHKQQ